MRQITWQVIRKNEPVKKLTAEYEKEIFRLMKLESENPAEATRLRKEVTNAYLKALDEIEARRAKNRKTEQERKDRKGQKAPTKPKAKTRKVRY